MARPDHNAISSTRPRGRRAKLALIALFLVALWLPLAENLLKLDHTAPTSENRTMAPPPALAWSELAIKEFPDRFEAWYDDRFGFRRFLVRQYHTVKTGWLGIGDPDLALIGKDGWLYLGQEQLIDEARGLERLSSEELREWTRRLGAIQEWQEERGGRFLLVLVPDKHRIYPEYLPDWFKASESRCKEQLLDALDDSGMDILDLTSSLRDAKSEAAERLWLKTDTHWSGVGAYYAYRAMMRQLDMAPMPSNALKLVDAPEDWEGVWHRSDNLAGFLGVRGLMPESWIGYAPKSPRAVPTIDYPAPSHHVGDVNVPFATRIDDPTLPKGMLIGDSFRWTLIPFLSEHFQRMLYTDFRYCFFDPDVAAAIDPDFIIFLMTERQIKRMPLPPEGKMW